VNDLALFGGERAFKDSEQLGEPRGEEKGIDLFFPLRLGVEDQIDLSVSGADAPRQGEVVPIEIEIDRVDLRHDAVDPEGILRKACLVYPA